MQNKAKKIKMICMDVDGVLTNGSIILGNGEELKFFNVKDGLGIKLAQKAGIITVIMTGRNSICVDRRAKELDIPEVHQGVADKIKLVENLRKKYNLKYDEIAFIGDDLPDIPVMKKVGFSMAPNDAVSEVKTIADYVTQSNGGNGAVREIIDAILKSKGIFKNI